MAQIEIIDHARACTNSVLQNPVCSRTLLCNVCIFFNFRHFESGAACARRLLLECLVRRSASCSVFLSPLNRPQAFFHFTRSCKHHHDAKHRSRTTRA